MAIAIRGADRRCRASDPVESCYRTPVALGYLVQAHSAGTVALFLMQVWILANAPDRPGSLKTPVPHVEGLLRGRRPWVNWIASHAVFGPRSHRNASVAAEVGSAMRMLVYVGSDCMVRSEGGPVGAESDLGSAPRPLPEQTSESPDA